MQCSAIIDLSRPTGRERVRSFQPPWRTVYVYACRECGAKHRVGANAFRGSRPEPGKGGIRCGRERAEV